MLMGRMKTWNKVRVVREREREREMTKNFLSFLDFSVSNGVQLSYSKERKNSSFSSWMRSFFILKTNIQ